MALTRKSLKAMGLTDEQVDSIIEMHTETVDGLKAETERLQTEAKDLPVLQRKLEAAEKELETTRQDGWKDKHDAVKQEFDQYKAEQTAKETRAAKEAAVRAYLESKHITGKGLAIAMRGLSQEIDGAELEGDRLKDTKTLDDLIAGELAPLVSATEVKGAEVSTPPQAGSVGGKPAGTPSRAAVLAAKYHENLYGKVKEG